MTLKLQVGVATAALAAFIVIVLATVAAFISERESQSAASLQLSEVAYAFADRLDRSLSQRANTLALIAKLPVQDIWERGDVGAMRQVVDMTKKYITGAAWLGFADREGRVVAGSDRLLEGQSVRERPWFQSGLGGTSFGDVHEAKLLAPLLGPSPDGQPYRFVDVSTPVFGSGGRLLGVLGLHIGWNWVADIRTALVASHIALSGLDLSIVSRDGKPLLAGTAAVPLPDFGLAQMKEHGRGTFEITGRRESDLIGYARLESVEQLGWFVVARQPAYAALGAAHALAGAILTTGVLVGIMGFIGAIVIAGRVSRPIRRLTGTADRIGRDSNDMLPRVRGSLEVVQLSTALRSLLLRLGRAEQHTAEIENQAADATRRLESDIATLRSMVDVDALTGLQNRRGFMKDAEDAMDQFRRYGHVFGVLMIDIDHFKSVNDTHGHAVGDAAIRQVAATIRAAVRPSDRCGRFGGEEFIVLLREGMLAEGAEAAERIRAAVAACALPSGNVELTFTVSIGVAIATDTDRDIQDIVERADVALYSAKGTGRNRIATAPAASETRLSA
jgi:diguanylate cyclase (GGDEF)-like protein